MSMPTPESNNDAYDLTEPPPGEHASELADEDDGDQADPALQDENAETSLDQPSH